MTLRYLLDTATLSLLAAPQPDSRVAGRMAAVSRDCCIASVVWHELLYGMERMPAGARKSFLSGFLYDFVIETFPVLPYDERAAAWHAVERARLDAVGRTRPILDGQVAAVAAVNGLTVVTANVRDFEPFEGVTIEDWSTRS